jgi:Putative prokaryotic signal transducing protein
MRPREPVVVATFSLPTQAEMARELLETNGIEARLRDQGFIGVYPWMSTVMGGVKLVVAAEEAELAREILEQAGLVARS